MNLIKELSKAKGFTGCLALTYNVNLPWFERVVLRQLRRQGLRHFVILADRARLSEEIGQHLDLVSALGRLYSALGVHVSGSFHPKLLLLTGERAARLYVGSGNLTSSGYGRNLEIFERWDVSPQDASLPGAFAEVRRFLKKLASESLGAIPDVTAAALDAVLGAPVLERPSTVSPEAIIWSSPGPLFARLPEMPGPASRLTMVAPSFDADGEAAIELARRLRASSFEVLTDLRTTNLTSKAFDAICAAGGVVRNVLDRPLHAKALHAEGKGWELSICGSANLSRAAWRGMNAELVVVRRDELARPVRALLDQLDTEDVSEEERDALDSFAEPPTSVVAGPALQDVRWESAEVIRAVMVAGSPPTGAELLAGARTTPISLREMQLGMGGVRVRVEAGIRGRPAALRVVSAQGPGPWSAVHDPEELSETVREKSPSEAMLRELLAEDDFDADGARRLLDLMSRLWQERREETRPPDATNRQDGTPETLPERPDWHWVSEDDFRSREETSVAPLEPRLRELPLPAALLRRLLFGEDVSTGDFDDQNSESDGSEPVERASGKERKATQLRSQEAQRSFLEAAQGAVDIYTRKLSSDVTRSAARLLDDLQLLTAVLHYAVRARALSVSDFRRQLVTLLHEFWGTRGAPFPRALERTPSEQRHAVWGRAPVLLLGTVLLYNAALADFYVLPDDRDPSALASDLALPLWLRNLLHAAPEGTIEEALTSLESQLAGLRRGELWLDSLWPSLAARVPFESFARRLLEASRDIMAAERLLLASLAHPHAEPEDGDPVLMVGRDGSLAAGRAEREGRALRVLLYDSAFLLMKPRPPYRPMALVPGRGRAVSIDVVRTWGSLQADDAAMRGLEALEKMV